mmetsp:Transcript_34042/g.115475  ORF Transcript_34042/g.115475 Transcript_34042/m.115475 type:complete len:241 (+) Transcript_34042:194-916(+)
MSHVTKPLNSERKSADLSSATETTWSRCWLPPPDDASLPSQIEMIFAAMAREFDSPKLVSSSSSGTSSRSSTRKTQYVSALPKTRPTDRGVVADNKRTGSSSTPTSCMNVARCRFFSLRARLSVADVSTAMRSAAASSAFASLAPSSPGYIWHQASTAISQAMGSAALAATAAWLMSVRCQLSAATPAAADSMSWRRTSRGARALLTTMETSVSASSRIFGRRKTPMSSSSSESLSVTQS